MIFEQILSTNFVRKCIEISLENLYVDPVSRGGAVARALASHQCGLGSNPSIEAICGLSLLVLSLASSGFSPGTPVFLSPKKPTFPNCNSTRNQVDEEPLGGFATSQSNYKLCPKLIQETGAPIGSVSFNVNVAVNFLSQVDIIFLLFQCH